MFLALMLRKSEKILFMQKSTKYIYTKYVKMYYTCTIVFSKILEVKIMEAITHGMFI